MSSHPDNSTRGAAPDPAPGPTVQWGILGIVVTVLVVILCEVGFHLQVRDESDRKAGAMKTSAANVLRSDQEAWLASESADRNRIMIDDAMGDVIDGYGGGR